MTVSSDVSVEGGRTASEFAPRSEVRSEGTFHRRASDAALRNAAEKMRASFVQVAQRDLIADGVVITAMAEALAAVEAALGASPASSA